MKCVINRLTNSTKRRGQRGSVLVEMSIVLSMLIMLLLGILEGGVLIRNRNQIANAVESATRRAHISANKATADERILKTIKDHALGPPLIEKVVVFRVKVDELTETLTEISSDCAAGIADSGKCNVYSGHDLGKSAGALNSSSWPPASREGAPEYIGVLVIAKHDSPTGLFSTHRFKAESRMIQAPPQS